MGYKVRAHIGIVMTDSDEKLRSLLEIATVDMSVASDEFDAACEDGERKPIRLFSSIDGNKSANIDDYGDSLIIVDPKKLLKGIKDSKYRRDKILVATLKATMANFKHELKEKTLKVVMRHY